MCYMKCEYEYHYGENKGECSLAFKDVIEKCPNKDDEENEEKED